MSSITSATAVATGTLSNVGNATVTARGFWIRRHNESGHREVLATTTNNTFSVTLTGLHANSRYYIRAIARTSGTSGSWQSDPPTVFTTAQTTFTVTFNANGGSGGPGTRHVPSGNEVGALTPNPTRTGHTFAGWFTAQTGGERVEPTRRITGNVTFFARWNTVITFNANGGTVVPSTMTVLSNTIILLPTPTRAGYDFLGWGASPQGPLAFGEGPLAFGEADVYADQGIEFVYGNEQYTGFAYENERDNEQDISLAYENERDIALAYESEQDNEQDISLAYENGIIDASAGGAYDTNAETSDASIDGYGVGADAYDTSAEAYDTSTDAYNIGVEAHNVHNANDETGIESTASYSADTEAYGYSLIEAASALLTGSFTANGHRTFYAYWERRQIFVTVTFNPMGGTMNQNQTSRLVLSGSEVGPLPDDPVRDGWRFLGWFRDTQYGGVAITASYRVTSNTTFFAMWVRNNSIITFNSMGGAPVGSISVAPGNRIGNVPAPLRVEPHMFGQYFLGWYTHRTSGHRVEPTYMPTRDMTLYARWTCSPSRFPDRLLGRWYPSNTVSLRTFDVDPSLTNWRMSMYIGMNNWNAHPDSPVSFYQSPTSDNRAVTIPAPTTGECLGSFTYVGMGIFRITLYFENIFEHAEDFEVPLNRVIASVMAHELGHAVGLRDGDSPPEHPTILGGCRDGSIMNGNRCRGFIVGPTPFDIESVGFIYD